MSNIVYQNGMFLEESRVKINLTDSSFLWGAGFFETIRVSQGVAIFLEEHLDRLFAALKEFELTAPVSKMRLKFLVYETLSLNHLKEAVLRIWISYDMGELGSMDFKKAHPSLVISCKSYEALSEQIYQDGVSCILVQDYHSQSGRLSNYKSCSYFNSVIAKQKARQAGAFEALMCNTQQRISEGASSNVFVVQKSKIYTPPLHEGLLPGISRSKVMQLCEKMGMPCLEKALSIEDLFQADEVFLTSSLKHVLGVIEVGEKQFSNGKVGMVTQKVSEIYLEHLQWYVEQTLSEQSGIMG